MVVENAVGKCPQVVANIAGFHVTCLIDLQVGVRRVNSDRGFLPLPPRGEGQPTYGYIIMGCDDINPRLAVLYVEFVNMWTETSGNVFFFVVKDTTNHKMSQL